MIEANNDPPTQSVFDVFLARPVAAPDLQQGRLIHLQWSAPQQGDRLVQFYVDGELAGYTLTSSQRESWLLIDACSHTQIEALAVAPGAVTKPMPDALGGVEPVTNPAASLVVMRDQTLPIDSVVQIAFDDPPAPDQTPLFAPSAPRGGFGAVFGEGGFGFDASTGPGLGLGQLGYGPLGTDGLALHWRHDGLDPGEHAIELTLRDARGSNLVDPLTLQTSITRLPEPPTDLSLSPDLTLTWT